MKAPALCCALLAMAASLALGQTADTNRPAAKDPDALRNVTILIIRHAEKPASGTDLTPAGAARADAYPDYFKKFILDEKPLKLDCLYATMDSKGSHRERLTLEPLGKSLGLPLDMRFKAKETQELADDIQSKPHGKQILICWHHGEIPAIIKSLGADPQQLLPGGKWPDDVFSWVVELRYDADGHLIPSESKCVNENLMPGDADKKPGGV